MDLEETLRKLLTSYIKSSEKAKERKSELVNNIEEVVKKSPLFKVLKEFSNYNDLIVFQDNCLYAENEINNINCFIKIQQTPRIVIELLQEFKLIFYPTINRIITIIVDSNNRGKILFNYDITLEKLQEKIKKIDKGQEKNVQDKLSKLLSSLKDDKILNVLAKALIIKLVQSQKPNVINLEKL